MRSVLVLAMVMCCASAARAQNTYVSGSLSGEIARFSFVESEPRPAFAPRDVSFDGETAGFALSLERALGPRWGVALEFVRPGTMSYDDSVELPITIQIFPVVPPVQLDRHIEQRRLSVNTLAWLSQSMGSRVELAFLAGTSFTRTRVTQRSTVTVPALMQIRPEFIEAVAPSTTTTDFGVDPVVGLDARFRVSNHVSIVPGVRFQSGSVGSRPGWLVRPSAGIRFGF